MADKPKEDVNSLLSEVINTFVSLIEEKDEFMRGHAQRVASNCVHFSRQLNLDKNEIQQLYFAGLLHDIAMVYVPVEIFQRSGSLNEHEKSLIKQHPVMAEKVLSNISLFKNILPIIRHHHEAFDGSGYPDGLKGDEIPFAARLLCLVDSYDAMTSPRSDRPAMSTPEALRGLVKNAGTKFDKSLIKDFIEFIKSTAGSFQEKVEKKEGTDTGTVQKIVTEVVHRFKRGNIDLPVLPKIVQDIQTVINQPDSTSNDVAGALEKDAVISVRLISVANSPVYRGAEKIYSVKQAVPRLGFKEAQNIVTAIANKNLYETKNNQFKMLMEKLWLHSLGCGYCARIIAKKLRLRFGDAEQIFLMGLIHDIGKPPLLKAVSENIPKDESLPMNDIVASIQEVHTGFGKEILEHWGFTKDFTRIAVEHEGPGFSSTTDKSVLIVNLANNIVRKIGYSLFDDEGDLSDLESVKMLEIDDDTINTIREETIKTLQGTSHIF